MKKEAHPFDNRVNSRAKRFRRKVRQREKRHHRNGGKRSWKLAIRVKTFELARLMAPAIFSIYNRDARIQVLNFLTKLRYHLLQSKNSLIVDFTQTTLMHSPATLLFAAELDRCIRLKNPDQKLAAKLAPDSKSKETRIVREVLHQVGILENLDYDCSNFKTDGYDETVRNWRYATGTRADDSPGDILDEHEGKLAPAIMKGMQVGLAEAILNSLHHAYSGHRGDKCQKFNERRWWMFTHQSGGDINVMVCDLGIGIRKSLPAKWGRGTIAGLIKDFGRTEPDVSAIRVALEVGKSSTGDVNRGLGLPQIWTATRETDDGEVGIYSGNGYLGYVTKDDRENAAQFEGSILGTLIAWRAPIIAEGGSG